MITITDQLFLSLGLPLDRKLSNLTLIGNNVKVESISEYLQRVDVNSRYLGLEVNIISPAGEYDINFFINNSKNNVFSVTKYKFDQNITDSGLVISSSGSSVGHIIRNNIQSFTNRPNLTFRGSLNIEDNDIENSTVITTVVDDEFLQNSENPVQNKVISEAINDLYNKVAESEIIDVSDAPIYNPSKVGGYLAGDFVSYINLSSPDPKYQVYAIYLAQADIPMGQSPEVNSDWE